MEALTLLLGLVLGCSFLKVMKEIKEILDYICQTESGTKRD